MKDLKRVSYAAIVFLVLLRISIGWQFLYEGLWKLDTQDTARPWSAAGYLKNAQGPFRDHFRGMVGDPDDLNWLDYQHMSAEWTDWQRRFASHYGLDETQQRQLTELLEGKRVHETGLAAIPDAAADLVDRLTRMGVLEFDAEAKRLRVYGDKPLKPSEAAELQSKVPVVKVDGEYGLADEEGNPVRNDDGSLAAPDEADLEFYKAVESLEQQSARLGYLQRLAALLRGNPDRVGAVAVLTDRGYRPEMRPQLTEEQAAEAITTRYGEIQIYRNLLDEYEAGLKSARVEYQHEHLSRIARRIASLRSELVGPVRALDAELKQEARELLSPEQFARGPLPVERDQLWRVNQATIWGLIILGGLLMLGFISRLAALGGAVMLIMFYLPVPPWPGVIYPEEVLGPEHSYIINKNLIEAIALLAIAMLPTGSWFGVDGLFRWIFARRAAT
ncbi:MAG: hypothetical protein DWQ34_01855 [Planctomycetota bacterium]|nr:MAG: hypothetical protein DWQ29_17390 [Planctomycetota bacterium]REJ97556.1 MAG: hypothetical protein DWQ34_01855 [Planctomycetota bacterium]REK26917.1 MAG: hypothetical protein DWQ41_08755 [Planctomycetota bacterium]REK35406.1 MAG: hypothetical protein DWQ45_11870 [Planctomycetota bacterium]